MESKKRVRVKEQLLSLTCFDLAECFGDTTHLSSFLEQTLKNFLYDHPLYDNGFKPVFFSRMPEYECVISLLNFLDKKQIPTFMLYLKQMINMRKTSGGDERGEVVVSEKLFGLLEEIANKSKFWERRKE